MFSDLLPIPIAKLWRLLRYTLMICVVGMVVGMSTIGKGRTIDHPLVPPSESNSEDLMHDIIQVPQVSAPMPHARVIWMQVTAYCPCPKCCGPHASGITASGKLVNYNSGEFIAADTSLLPFGTKVIVPGYSTTPVEVIDRGSAIKGNHIDVFFTSHEQAMHWGRQWIPVTVLD